MRYAVEFENPIFHRGVNITVRLGMKWMEALNIGDTISLIKPGERVTAVSRVGEVTGLACIPFNFMPAEWLRFEHNPNCQTLSGLLDTLHNIYGSFGAFAPVTIIFFIPEEKK
jgi:hypothetical protein